VGGIPPALQILGKISSNFFESTPQKDLLNLYLTNLVVNGWDENLFDTEQSEVLKRSETSHPHRSS